MREVRYETALSNEARRRIEEIGQADILVGIPSFNNESTIGYVVKQAAEGMIKYFPEMRPVLINSDGGSSDNTREVVMETKTSPEVEKIVTVYQGIPGKGSSFRAIFEIARALGVKVCVVVDSDLRSITPEWIKLLAEPIVKEGFGYVTPWYSRHKYDGTITNSIAYPLTRALYGKRIRQPIGGDFGFSAELCDHYLNMDVWETDVARFGIDIFMTTVAINEGFKVCQANLGAKIHDAKDPAATLGPMFRQVVGSVWRMMKIYEDNWRDIKGSEVVKRYGPEKLLPPEPVNVNLKALVDCFKEGFEEFGLFWKDFLSEETFAGLTKSAESPQDSFSLPPELWVRTVFDFAVEYNFGDHNPDEVVDSMIPVYFGRTASFVVQTKDMSSAEAEKIIDHLAQVYEKEKGYLIKRWEEKRA